MDGDFLGGVKGPGTRSKRPGRDQRRPFMSRTTPALRQPSRLAGSLLFEILSVVGSLAAIWIGVAIGLSHERSVDQQQALSATKDLARAFEEGTQRTVSEIDSTLLSARAVRMAQGDDFVLRQWAKTQTASDRLRAQISTADANGNVTDSTLPIAGKVNIADRAHFKAQTDPTDDELYISRPVIGRVSNKETIQFTRKLSNRNGTFDGVIVFSLNCEELSRDYETLDLHGGYLALLSTDGTVLARGPVVPGLVGTKIVDGGTLDWMLSAHAGSRQINGPGKTTQFASFRALQDNKLLVMVAFDADHFMSGYHMLSKQAILGGIIGSIAVGLIGMWWINEKQTSRRASHALKVTLDTIDQGILMLDRHGGVPVINPRALNILGFRNDRSSPVASAVAAKAVQFVSRESPDGIRLQRRAASSQVLETVSDEGRIIEVHTHALPEGERVYTYSDVTDQRMAEQRVRYVAYHDSLTGLANRLQLNDRLTGLLTDAADTKSLIALLLLDLDGFKNINDTLGHKVGDELLTEIGRRLPGTVRESDIVARLGGDEFVIAVAGLHANDDIAPIVQRILNQFVIPVAIGDHVVQVSCSIGISFYPNDGHDAETLCKHADIALYAAKGEGRGSFCFFDPSLAQAVRDKRDLETDLRRALRQETLEVYFQPKFDCSTLRIVGLEALLRWKHPERGFISPAVFVPLAEDCGLIRPLGLWVLHHACAAAASWKPSLPVAVNVSVPQLRDPELRAEVASILARTGLDPSQLELEVTESVMADDDPTVMANLQGIKAMGISISLDDFGTGYSSLSYLRRFPFDKIKIDKSFVQSQTTDAGVRVIVDAIMSMCHNLGLTTVAEGVETTQQLAMLNARGCAQVQGFLLARPMPEAMVESFISQPGPILLSDLMREDTPKIEA